MLISLNDIGFCIFGAGLAVLIGGLYLNHENIMVIAAVLIIISVFIVAYGRGALD